MPILKNKKKLPVHKKVSKAAMKGHLTQKTMFNKYGLEPKFQPAVIEVAEKIQRANFIVGATGAPGKFISKWGKRVVVISGAFVGLRASDVLKEIKESNKELEKFNRLNKKVNPGAQDVTYPFGSQIKEGIKNTEFRIAIPDITKKEPIKQYLKGPGGAMVIGGVATIILMTFIRNKIRTAINDMRAKKAIKKL